MRLLVGLGNPGQKYQRNRHNIGFMAVDEIVRRHHFSDWSKKFQAEVADGVIGGVKFLAVKPQTFMNSSGQAVQAATAFYKIAPQDILVLHDELDLPPGKLRVKKGGGSGGHNGIKSIDAHLGPDYWRLRLGIGHPEDREMVSPYVLSDFSSSDADWLAPMLDSLAKHASSLSADDMDGYMTKVAQETAPKPTAKEKDIKDGI